MDLCVAAWSSATPSGARARGLSECSGGGADADVRQWKPLDPRGNIKGDRERERVFGEGCRAGGTGDGGFGFPAVLLRAIQHGAVRVGRNGPVSCYMCPNQPHNPPHPIPPGPD